MNNKERNKAIWRLMRQRLHTEKVVLSILTLSVAYAFISNLLTHCSPLPSYSIILNTLSSIDETLRNCSYGVIASITFYLVNDFYKNSYKKVDLYSAMFPDLYHLWLKTYQLILAINNYELDESHSNADLQSSIIKNLCKHSDEEISYRRNYDISADLFHVLYLSWFDALKDKEKFLETFGHVIEREEFSKLNDKELDISIERLKEHIPTDDQIVKATPITISDYDIQRAIYLILKYKTDLASMVNKYSAFYYGEQRGVRKDAF